MMYSIQHVRGPEGPISLRVDRGQIEVAIWPYVCMDKVTREHVERRVERIWQAWPTQRYCHVAEPSCREERRVIDVTIAFLDDVHIGHVGTVEVTDVLVRDLVPHAVRLVTTARLMTQITCLGVRMAVGVETVDAYGSAPMLVHALCFHGGTEDGAPKWITKSLAEAWTMQVDNARVATIAERMGNFSMLEADLSSCW